MLLNFFKFFFYFIIFIPQLFETCYMISAQNVYIYIKNRFFISILLFKLASYTY